jgi:hypothetical protein
LLRKISDGSDVIVKEEKELEKKDKIKEMG